MPNNLLKLSENKTTKELMGSQLFKNIRNKECIFALTIQLQKILKSLMREILKGLGYLEHKKQVTELF